LAEAAFQRFLENRFAPELHNKAIGDNDKGRYRVGTRSVWINYRYRALYVVDGATNVWYWIGSHEDYNDFIGGT
jgi:hypothetical protein